MQRPNSKKTRQANAQEKAFMGWIKERPCCICNKPGLSIVEHCQGSAKKVKVNLITVLIGTWFLIPLCEKCDAIKTRGSYREFVNLFGLMNILCLKQLEEYPEEVPEEVIQGIAGCGR